MKPGLPHQFADAPTEPLHQAVGLRVARRAQPMLDARCSTAHIEVMLVAGISCLSCEAFGEDFG